MSMYLREVANVPPLTKEEEKVLWQQAQTRDTNQVELAKRRLIESRLSMVVDIAERYMSSGVPMLELLQEGNIGLMAAVDTFLKKPDSDFSKHAHACIERAIGSAIAESRSSSEPLLIFQVLPEHRLGGVEAAVDHAHQHLLVRFLRV